MGEVDRLERMLAWDEPPKVAPRAGEGNQPQMNLVMVVGSRDQIKLGGAPPIPKQLTELLAEVNAEPVEAKVVHESPKMLMEKNRVIRK